MSLLVKSIILFCSFILSFNDSFSQTKKEQIRLLNIYIDSLNQEILNQNKSISVYLSKINELNKDISILQNELNSRKLETLTLVENADKLKIIIQELRDSINILNKSKTQKFIFPYKYLEPIYIPDNDRYYLTTDLNGLNEKQIVTDSLTVKFDENQIYHFYFFTPLVENLRLECPNDFGYMIFDDSGQEIYSVFDRSEIGGNSFKGYIEFNLKQKMRRLLMISDSGCGSGGGTQYIDLEIKNQKLKISNWIHASTTGYEFTYFLPEKELYINVQRLNPKAHWEGATRYSIDFFSFNNDQQVGTKKTKNIYPHFGDIGENELIKMIKKREPSIFN